MNGEWDILTRSKLIAFGVGMALFLVLIFKSEPGFVLVVDHANLLFHEAGHPVVGLFSQRLEPYGGTIGQLIFPAVLAVSFWRKRQSISTAVCTIWFFENFLNIACYVADARRQVLPLVGGGNHDWNTILARWNALPFDEHIAGILKIIGWLGMFAACAWIGWRAWQDRNRNAPEMDFALPPPLP